MNAIPVNQFVDDSLRVLREVLSAEGTRLTNLIDTLERKSDLQAGYYGYLKDFLINSLLLADDVLAAARNDAVLLAMIGARVMLEDVINAHYLATKTTDADHMALAKEWLDRSNNPKAYKNMLDGISVAQRAETAGVEAKALYDNEYTLFCNYTHSSAQRGLLNVPHLRALAAKKAVWVSIRSYANIVTCIAGITSEPVPDKVINDVKAFFDKYRQSVAQAQLPIENNDQLANNEADQ